jgi:hypothetical protein
VYYGVVVGPLALTRSEVWRIVVAGGLLGCPLLVSAQYRAIVLDSGGFTNAYALGIHDGVAVGYGYSNSPAFVSHALMWGPGGVLDINPGGDFVSSDARSKRGDQIAGSGSGPVTGAQHALLWSGGSYSDLHPSGGLVASTAEATNGHQQVGYTYDFGNTRAAKWSGTPESYVDLTPPGATGASATAIASDGTVGGAASFGAGPGHAVIWTGGPANYEDLHPGGFTSSAILAMSDTDQVGDGTPNGTTRLHAVRWTGNGATAVDLHPTTGIFTSSRATGTNGLVQVGFVQNSNGQHGAAWTGSAGSFLDLHSFLSPGYTQSAATGVDGDGNIAGSAIYGSHSVAVIWQPVPEPTSCTVLAVLWGSFLCLRVRRR